MKAYIHIDLYMNIHSSFVIERENNPNVYQQVNGYIWCYIHTMEYNEAIKKKELLIHNMNKSENYAE